MKAIVKGIFSFVGIGAVCLLIALTYLKMANQPEKSASVDTQLDIDGPVSKPPFFKKLTKNN